MPLKQKWINICKRKVNLKQQTEAGTYNALPNSPKVLVARLINLPRIIANILNDMQFEYDGSVHYRQKMGSFNLTARYEKPTLLVQAKVPMVLDLNNYKFISILL